MLFNSHLESKNVAKNIFAIILCVKIFAYFVFLAVGVDTWHPSNDANHYHDVAKGLIVNDARAWGLFLKFLNENGLYARTPIAILIFLCGCLFFPYLLYLSVRNEEDSVRVEDWWLLNVASIYPTLTFFSFDIYRDLPMVLMYLGALIFVKKLVLQPSTLVSKQNFKYFLCLLMILYLTYLFRFYLAAAIVLALAACYVFDVSKRFFVFLLFLNASLIFVDAMGFFDWMKFDFRPSQAAAGSAYGIDFIEGYFLVNFWKSFFANIYGFFYFGFASMLLFVFESVPALILTVYLYINRNYIDRYVSFLVIFFFIYSAAWVVGIDVLGTGVRYRIFNYLTLLVAASTIYKTISATRQSVS